MRSRPLSFLALLCALGVLLLGCDGERALGPEDFGSLIGLSASTNVLPTPVSPVRIDIAWQDNASKETGHEIHRSSGGASGVFARRAALAADASAYSDVGLAVLTEYCYRVRPVRRDGSKVHYGAFSGAACARTTAVPTAPSGTRASALGDTVTVRWDQLSAGQTGFRIERGPAPDGPWTAVAATQAAVTMHREIVAAEVQVCFRVIAFNSFGSSPPSAPDCTTSPATPTDLTATSVDDRSIDVGWIDRSMVEDGYELQRSLNQSAWTSIATLPANATSYRNDGLASDTRYWYRVRALKDDGFSDFSDADDAVTVGTRPAAPVSTSVKPTSSTSVFVEWNPSSINSEAFRVERSVDGGMSWVAAATVTGSSFEDGGRAPEVEVCHRVFATNRLGDSPPSTVDCTVPPAAPTDLVAESSAEGTIDLRWSDNSATNGAYLIQQRGYYYYYYYSYDHNYSWFTVATIGGEATSHRVTDQPIGVLHHFRVVAQRDGGPSDPSNVAASYPSPTPAAPSNLRATAVSAGRVDLTWVDNSTNEVSFTIDRCTGSSSACGDADFHHLASVAAGSTSYSDTSAQPGVTYTYRVRANNNGPSSAPSNEATVTTPSGEE